MTPGHRSTPDLVAHVFDAARCRRDLRQLRHVLNQRSAVLDGGPLDGCRFPVERYAKAGTSTGIAQQTPRGLVTVLYQLHADGVWRFRELSAVGW